MQLLASTSPRHRPHHTTSLEAAVGAAARRARATGSAVSSLSSGTFEGRMPCGTRVDALGCHFKAVYIVGLQ